MRNTIIIILFATLFMSSTKQEGYIPVKDLKSLEEKINNASTKIQTIKSDFIQEKHLEYLDAVINSTGKFWFKKGNKLRWEYFEPFKYIVVINNGKFTFSDDGDISEYNSKSNSVFQKINDLIINSVKGSLLADDEFLIKAFENSIASLIQLIN